MGIGSCATKVGDRYVVEAMRAGGYNLGGEQSGHVVFLDHNTTGDGLHHRAPGARDHAPQGAAALGARRAASQRFPQVLLNVRVAEKRPLESLPELRRRCARSKPSSPARAAC